MSSYQLDLHESDWEGCAIKARQRDDLFLIEVKTLKRASAIAEELGLPGPCEANANAIWLGPREWLLIGSSAKEYDRLVEYLERQRRDEHAAYSDMSNALLTLELSCEPALVTKLTGLPKDSLAPGRTACTRWGHVKTLFVNSPDQHLWMIFTREYARHMHAWMDQAV